MDENILFSYELKDAWFLPIAGVEVYKTGEVRCMTGDEDRTSILDAQALAEIENVIGSHPENCSSTSLRILLRLRFMTESATSSALAQRMAEALSLSRSISGHCEKKNTATSVHTLPMKRECAFCRFSIR